MKKSILICAGLLWLCTYFLSCYSEKKAVKDTTKGLFYYPDTVSAILRSKFPCVPVIFDTSGFVANRRYNDSVLLVLERGYDSLAFIMAMPIDTFNTTDTIVDMEKVEELARQLKQYKASNSKLLYDLKLASTFRIIEKPVPVKDEAAINAITVQLNKAVTELTVQKDLVASTKDKVNWWRLACIITWSVIAISILLYILIKRK